MTPCCYLLTASEGDVDGSSSLLYYRYNVDRIVTLRGYP